MAPSDIPIMVTLREACADCGYIDETMPNAKALIAEGLYCHRCVADLADSLKALNDKLQS